MSDSGFFSHGETYRRAYVDQALPMISYGLRFQEACVQAVERLGATKVYVLASRSLATNSNSLTVLKKALDGRVVGEHVGITAHTPISECLEIIGAIRKLDGVDCLITLGGGSGEYQSIAGATETVSRAKRSFEPKVNPTLAIQDPELCLLTPQWLWLSSGIRAVDHCVETLCSLQSNAKGDEEARKGLVKLVPGLLRCKQDVNDIEARHLCQLGVVEAMSAVSSGVPLGASHAIGHQLGPLGVGHGETSCILLPAVCKYNAAQNANNERQKAVLDLLLRDETVREVVRSDDLTELDLGDVLDRVIRKLGMPRSLKEVNVGRDKLDMLATNSLQDVWIKTNAVPMTEKSQVMEVLEMVIG
ncbi:hypothetical protein ACLOAV_002658 [Pseudogymnoascus australis]